jgi:hypothetical protein
MLQQCARYNASICLSQKRIGAAMRDAWALPLLHIGGGGWAMIPLGERAMG